MQLRSKWGALALVVLLLSSLGTAGLVFAKSDSSVPAAQTSASSSLPAKLQTAPLNPAYVQYQQEKAAGKVATQTVDGHGLGWVPPPYELSNLTAAPRLMQAQTYAPTYDLRTQGKASPVEDQGNCGSCWTFATFGSLESYLWPGLKTIFSENNLKNLADFTYTCCNGGDAEMSTAYLARWGTTMTDNTGSRIYAGPVTSASDPYSTSCTSPTTSQIAMHVQNVYFLPLGDNNAIKFALTTYGGVYTAFQWDGGTSTSSYYNSATAAYYDGTKEQGNHAVTIMGWDDNFSAKNFSTTPPGNGAWLCKNSWGAFGKSNSGYFYVSYYDANMGHIENAVFTAEPTTNYTTNYQYDPFGMENSIGSGYSSTAYGANVFTATSTGTLKAVSFWAPYANTQYTAQVYINPTDSSNPTSGTLLSTISGTASVSYTGYFTESLSTTVPLTKGETFAVVIKFTAPQGYNYPVPVQQRSGDDSKAPNAVTGESFYSPDGTTWNDLAAYGGSATNSYVANIHAFASATAPITVASSPAVTAQNANSLDLFVNGSDGALYQKYWTGTTWTTSTSLGGNLTSDPAATSRAPGYMDVFMRGTDGALWSRNTTNNGTTWNAWYSIGGQILPGTGPAVCERGLNSLDVFVQGTDHVLYYTHWDGTTWSGWKSLGPGLTSSPGVTSQANGKIDVFVRGTDNAIWYREYSGTSWSNWIGLGGQVASGTGPAACSWGTGRLDVFVQGTDGVLYQKTWTGSSWSGWQSLSGKLTSSPAATSPASGAIDVVVRGTDNGLWQKTYKGGWSGWTSVAI
jgi:C1A family cysteine protease